MIKVAIFDLDGTLLNTIEDLANACNYALEKCGFPTHEVESYKTFVGDGRYKLIERIIPQDKKEEAVVNEVLGFFDEYYGAHMIDMTKPYDGVIELLDELKSNGIKLAIVSNKPHEFAIDIAKKYFGDRVDMVFGHRQGYETKPDPVTVLEVINTFGMEKDECIYIGDSNVDIITANNAGVKSIGVLWGFRTKEELEKEGATFTVSTTKEIDDIIYN